jgi:hypothetical protein
MPRSRKSRGANVSPVDPGHFFAMPERPGSFAGPAFYEPVKPIQ